jgi:hypothetical protein
MKKFEMLGRTLSKQEQKMIKGGDGPHTQFCDAGTSSYCCDLILTNGSHAQETVCASSEQGARVAAINKHFHETSNVTCEPS